MAGNVAARRGRKAAQRKKLLSARRKSEVTAEPSLAEVIAHAVEAPIYECLMPEDLTSGMGAVTVSRSFGAVVTTAYLLVDTFALGVKDTFVRVLDAEEHELSIEHLNATQPTIDADPAMVRKFLRDLVAWARDVGFEPHKDYETLEDIFGDVQTSEATFTFGKDGRPFYMPGPNETAFDIDRNLKIIARYEERRGLKPSPSSTISISGVQ